MKLTPPFFSNTRFSYISLGLAGILLGWSSFLQRKIQTKALASLQAFAGDK